MGGKQLGFSGYELTRAKKQTKWGFLRKSGRGEVSKSQA
jgi:hypothetical protein